MAQLRSRLLRFTIRENVRKIWRMISGSSPGGATVLTLSRRTSSSFSFRTDHLDPRRPLPNLLEAKHAPLWRQSSSLSRDQPGEENGGHRSSTLFSKLISCVGGLGALTLLSVNYQCDRDRDQYCTSCDLEKLQLPIIQSFQSRLPSVPRAQCFEGGSDGDDQSKNRPSKRYNFLAEAVEIAAPSVVYIQRRQQVSTFFGETMSVSSGSGFVVGDGTYVLTNAHVVGSSKTVQVELKSGRKLSGEVTDIDQVADLALIKVNLPPNEKLPALKFGSSSDLRPGEWVVALGSPLSLSNTTTAGIVSSVLRPSKELGLQHHKPDMEYVQTDAPITIGNSGGPLVNLDGEVIGVNTMTAGPGISFAIPSDFAQTFVENATKTARKKPTLWGLSRYAIGVSMLSVTPGFLVHIRHRIALPSEVTHGVFLAEVWPDGAASEAGLRRGDVIVRIDGKDVYTNRDVIEKVRTGKRLVMEVARGSRYVIITVQPEPLN